MFMSAQPSLLFELTNSHVSPTAEPSAELLKDLPFTVNRSEVRADRDEIAVLMNTHSQRLLTYLTPDYVHIINDSKIVGSGGSELARNLEAEGFETWH